jgi:hypothetical protein
MPIVFQTYSIGLTEDQRSTKHKQPIAHTKLDAGAASFDGIDRQGSMRGFWRR